MNIIRKSFRRVRKSILGKKEKTKGEDALPIASTDLQPSSLVISSCFSSAPSTSESSSASNLDSSASKFDSEEIGENEPNAENYGPLQPTPRESSKDGWLQIGNFEYRIKCPILGTGATCKVIEGRVIGTHKPVALKFIEKASTNMIYLEQECEAMKRADHENVLKLHGTADGEVQINGESMDAFVLGSDLAPHGDFFSVIKHGGKLSRELAQAYFKQAAEGVFHLHNQRIVHRDLKLQNLLLDSNFRLKIADFGVSKVLRKGLNTMKTYVVGTRGHIAPEIELERRYTKACDVFSLGVIFFILVAGYPPFEKAVYQDCWYKNLAAERPEKFWRKHNVKDIPEDCKDLIERMLCYQPMKRIRMKDVLQHKCLQGKILSQDELRKRMEPLAAEAKRVREQRRV